MKVPKIVVDTNVLLAALRSRRGASHRLLRLVDSGKSKLNVSVPLVLEYEAAAKAMLPATSLTARNINRIIDYLCAVANRQHVYYLWRPVTRDPKDDMILELAVAANCEVIVTFNKRDFRGAESFGLRVLTPQEFLREIGDLR